jgi:hypothetical protein
MNRIPAVYGNRELNLFFRPLVEVMESGFCFKGRQYPWSAVRSVEVSDSPFLIYFASVYPSATVTLDDGTRIRLNGRALSKQGQKARVGFFTSKSDAFVELVSLFRQHVVT